MSLMPEALPWQQDKWKILSGLYRTGRLPHALLFAGPEGVGKRQFASSFAGFMLCEAKTPSACGQCRSCMQIAAGHHPNILHLKRETDEKTGKQKRDISIAAVRALDEHFSLTSHYGQAKIVVIDPADALNASSANALLKTIEEPPRNAFLILISEQPQTLPATLRSRCQAVRFPCPERMHSLDWLGRGKDAEAALHAAYGAPLKAKALLESSLPQLQAWRDGLHKLAAGQADPLQWAQAIAASNKASVKETIAEFITWMSGAVGLEYAQHVTQGRKQRALAIEPVLREMTDAQRRIAASGTPQLILESLLVNWWRLNRQAKNV